MHPVIDLGIIQLPTLGATLGIGFILALLFLSHQARTFGYSFHTLHIATLWAFGGGAVGSRLCYMLLVNRHLNPSDLMNISDGTMFYGFLIGAAIVSAVHLRLTHHTVWHVWDMCIPAWIMMQIAGRIGCFFAGCCYGIPTDLPWGMKFTQPLAAAPKNVMLHPTQLYEAVGVSFIALTLFFVQKRKTFSGEIALLYLILYAALRFFIEFLRDDYRGGFFGGALSTSQVIALAVLPLSLPLFVVKQKRSTLNHNPQMSNIIERS